MNLNRTLLLLHLLLATGSRMATAGIDFRARADREEIALDETVVVTVEATWTEPRPNEYYVVEGAQFPKLKGLELTDSVSSKGESFPDGETTKYRRVFQYTFEPKEEGEAQTGLIKVHYYFIKPVQQADPEQEPGKAGKAASPKDNRLSRELDSITVTVVPRRGLGVAELITIGVGVLVFAACVAIFAISQSQKKQAAAKAEAERYDGAIEREFLAELEDIKSLRLAGEVKTYCGRLAEIAEGYLAQKPEASPFSAEDDRERDGGKGGLLSEIRDFAESTRFAGHVPSPQELDRMYGLVSEMIGQSLPDDAEPRPEEEIELREDYDGAGR